MKSTVFYDDMHRVRSVELIAEDGPDSLVLSKIAELVKTHSVPDIQVKRIGGIQSE